MPVSVHVLRSYEPDKDVPLIVFALPFRRAFVPGDINKQSQNHMYSEHCNNGCVEVAVRARHLHRTCGKEAENSLMLMTSSCVKRAESSLECLDCFS